MSAINYQKEDRLVELLKQLGGIANSLGAGLDDIAKQHVMETKHFRGQGRTYHHEAHATEMRFDATLIRPQAVALFAGDATAAELYIKMLQALHAAHDVVQGQRGKKTNESLSAAWFMRDFNDLIEKLKSSHPQEARLLEDLKVEVGNFSYEVIVEGTYFDFLKKKTSFVLKFLDPNYYKDPKPASYALAALAISIHDTSRMALLCGMQKSPVLSQSLTSQYNKLRNNFLIQELRRCMAAEATSTADEPVSTSKSMLFGAPLYKDRRKTLAPETPAKEVLAFMQIWGQNIRVICELSQETAELKLLRDCINSGDRLKLTPEQVETIYAFLMNKMRDELKPGGFCDGMRWTEDGIPAINAKYKDLYGKELDVFPEPYTAVWKEYRENADKVRERIASEVENPKQNPQQKKELQRAFINACMQLARNQTGLFMPGLDQKTSALHDEHLSNPNPLHRH